MVRLSPAEQENLHRGINTLVYGGSPDLIEVPIPPLVRDAGWFRSRYLESIVHVYLFPAFTSKMGPTSFSGKRYPAYGIMQSVMKDPTGNGRIWAAATSSNFGGDFGLMVPISNAEGFHAVVNHGLQHGKLKHLLAKGIDLVIEAPKGIPATDYVYEIAEQRGYFVVDQYTHPGSVTGYFPAMEYIAREAGRVIGAGFNYGAITGTCANLTAAHRNLRRLAPGPVKIFGVSSMSSREKVPAARTSEEIEDLRRIGGFAHREEWGSVLDFPIIESVGKEAAFRLNVHRVRTPPFVPAGPTSSLLEMGAYHLLERCAENDELESLMNEKGAIAFVLFCMDAYLGYVDDPGYTPFFGEIFS